LRYNSDLEALKQVKKNLGSNQRGDYLFAVWKPLSTQLVQKLDFNMGDLNHNFFVVCWQRLK